MMKVAVSHESANVRKASEMKTRRLGTIEVSEIGLG